MSERTVSTAQRGRMLASTIGKPVLFAVLMWLASAAGEISIPGTPVPITLQTFVMMLAGLMLSWRQAGSAVVLYLAAGAAGLPVFAGGASTAALFGPSAGFLIGFLPAVIVTALLRGKARLGLGSARRADRRPLLRRLTGRQPGGAVPVRHHDSVHGHACSVHDRGDCVDGLRDRRCHQGRRRVARGDRSGQAVLIRVAVVAANGSQ